MKHFDFKSVLSTIIAISAWLVVMVLLSPCLLTFTEGRDGGITVWNFVGIIYTLGVIGIIWYAIKRHNSKKEEEDGK